MSRNADSIFDRLINQGDTLPARAQNFMALSFPDSLSSCQAFEAADMVATASQRIASYIESSQPFWLIQTIYKNAAGTVVGIKTEYTETKPTWIPTALGTSLGV